jgi:hypothetical protein
MTIGAGGVLDLDLALGGGNSNNWYYVRVNRP